MRSTVDLEDGEPRTAPSRMVRSVGVPGAPPSDASEAAVPSSAIPDTSLCPSFTGFGRSSPNEPTRAPPRRQLDYRRLNVRSRPKRDGPHAPSVHASSSSPSAIGPPIGPPIRCLPPDVAPAGGKHRAGARVRAPRACTGARYGYLPRVYKPLRPCEDRSLEPDRRERYHESVTSARAAALTKCLRTLYPVPTP